MRTLITFLATCLLVLIASGTLASAPATAQERILHSFSGEPDGYFPLGALIADKNGNLYGTTYAGGASNTGSVFELVRPALPIEAWKEVVLYSFTGLSDGGSPMGGLVFDSRGNLYGTASQGGLADSFPGIGVVFELSPPASGNQWTETVIFNFSTYPAAVGYSPLGTMAIDAKGDLFGVNAAGGNGQAIDCGDAGCGTVFELQPPTTAGGPWTIVDLHDFLLNTPDGFGPNSIVLARDGSLYGTTTVGGTAANGTVFRLVPSPSGAWKYKVIYNFNPNNGSGDGNGPNAVIVDPFLGLVGTTQDFNLRNQRGTVFRLAPTSSGWKETILYTFTGGPDGSIPAAGVVVDGFGNLYGTTASGGSCAALSNGCGTVFKLSPSSSGWNKTTLRVFSGAPDGSGPQASLLLRNAILYGTTGNGGKAGGSGSGTVFRIIP